MIKAAAPSYRSRLSAGTVLLLASQIHGAVLLTTFYEVESDLEGNVESSDSTVGSGPFFTSQEMEFNNNHSGPIRAAASTLNKTGNHAGPGSFAIFGGDLDATDRPISWPVPSATNGPFAGAEANVEVRTSATTNVKIDAGSFSRTSIEFELGVGEVAEANLDLNYTIEIRNGTPNEAIVSWSLVGPDLTELGISNADARVASTFDQTFSTGTLREILTEPGTYTLTLQAEIPFQEFNNAQKVASATLNGVFFEVVPVPEAGSSSLLLLSLFYALRRRRRPIN